ncbi:MAG: polysaccharide biosynthesis tyrosine autokinase [Verrucomicrobia bacterium]|nr:polysaccharide biosynthesis tyrosine autokinase [Verrucomicrobiota bacterium]
MSEQPIALTPDRPARAAQFYARLNRYRVLLQRRWWVLLTGVLMALMALGAYLWLSPPSYISVGKMIVSIKLTIPDGSVYSEELNNFLGTQAALMESDVVLSRAQRRVTAKEPRWTAKEPALKVSVFPRTSIFKLQGVADDPEYVREFVQAVMEEYGLLKREMREQTSDTTLAGLTEEVARLEIELRKGEQSLVNFQSSNSIVFLQEQGNSAGSRLAALNTQIEGLKSEYALLETLTLEQNLERQRLLASPAGGSASLDLPTSATVFGNESDYLRAKQAILMIKAEQQELSEFLRPKHPKMIALTEEIARRERLLEIFRAQSLEQLESKKSSLTLQIQNLEKDIKEWEAKALESSKLMAEYRGLQANTDRTQKLYERLLATMQTVDVNKGISQETVTVMENATPARPGRPGILKSILLAVFGGLMLGGLVLMLVERLDDRMSSFTELQELFEENILGQIPKERGVGKRRELALIQADDTRHAFLEAYRNLRSSLLFSNDNGERPRLLLVTSSIPNDGKSVTAANLAINMATGGSRVLLVDSDLRKGTLHGRFTVAAHPGFTEVLAGKLNWPEAVQPTRVANLFLLPRGSSVQNSGELLLSQITERFLKDAAAQYEYVLVDTPPVMAADDVSSLASLVDGVLFVIRAEHTSARVARAALDNLYQRQARVLGVVFNAVRASTGEYYYYRYKDYYKAYPSA